MAEQRIVEYTPQEPSNRWVGRIEPDPQARRWTEGTIERVIECMDRDLGPLPEREYVVREGGA